MFISIPIDFHCVDKKYNANQNLSFLGGLLF